MSDALQDRDAAVIGRDDVDSYPQFEGEDLEFPTSADEYGTGPSAKHTDFDAATGKQTLDSTTFDVGALTKGLSDVVSATAKVVSAASDAHKSASTPRESVPSDSKESEAGKRGSSPTAPSKSPPVAVENSSAGVYVAAGLGTLLLVAAVAVAGKKNRRRSGV